MTLWTIASQAPLSMGFSSQEYWSRVSFPTSGDLPNPGIKSTSLASPALAGGFFTSSTTCKAPRIEPTSLKSPASASRFSPLAWLERTLLFIQFSSVTQSFPTLCDPWTAACQVSLSITNSELAQTHVHKVDDAIQPSHLLSPPFPPTFNLSQH